MKNKWIVIILVGLFVAGCNSRENNQARGPVDPALAKQAAAKLMQQGVAFLNQKEVTKAVVSFQGAIQVDPSDPQPYMILAEIFMRLKNFPEAINVLNRAASMFPENGYVFYMLSLANEANGTSLPAVLAARRSVELFKAQNNQEGLQQSAGLMQALIKTEQDKQNQPAKTKKGA